MDYEARILNCLGEHMTKKSLVDGAKLFSTVAGILAISLFAQWGHACSLWVARDSSCIYGDMQTGTLWTRSCPDTVCHRVGRYIDNIPCDNETICMPSNSMDGATNPNQLSTVCAKWYPINSDDAQMDGCASGQSEWRRVCQKYDPATYPTQTCSAPYPGDN